MLAVLSNRLLAVLVTVTLSYPKAFWPGAYQLAGSKLAEASKDPDPYQVLRAPKAAAGIWKRGTKLVPTEFNALEELYPKIPLSRSLP